MKASFTLVELLVVIALVATLAALFLPALNRAQESGRATACLSNLHQIGVALQLYVQDNNNRLPTMRDRSPGSSPATKPSRPARLDPATNALPSPDLVLSNQLGNLRVLRCPSDRKHLFEQTGSSYSWNSLLNGQDADHLIVMGLNFDPHQIPVMFDKEAFHAMRGPKKGVNYLYADGHIRNLLVLEGTK
jgi:prepilin-type processing-associated H-X9-DG protein